MALLFFFVRRHEGELAAAASAAILATFVGFLYLAGGVMTDPALCFCVVLAMVGFYEAITTNNKISELKQLPPGGSYHDSMIKNYKFSGYIFFAALGLGLLAKGPLIFVLVGFPIFIWVLVKNKWRDSFRNLPWLGGIALMLAIAAPWYFLAERATPGFLNYFIVGEHFQRYITPNWSGDLYGEGRGGFPGKIWLFYFAAIAPWSVWIAIKLFGKKFRNTIASAGFFKNEFLFYNFAFVIAPLLFFTFSRNIVPAYVLPALPATAVLLSIIVGARGNAPLENSSLESRARSRAPLLIFYWFGGALAAICIAAAALEIFVPKWSANLGISDKHFIEQCGEKNIYYYQTKVPYSAKFYSRGRVARVEEIPADYNACVIVKEKGKRKIKN
jgi:4-amino-4-deoxy-L-arabinose transferase-like glycosyltransferase